MSTPLTSLSVVIPAYNESATIALSVEDALRVGDELSEELEVVVCNDGSTDNTGDILDELVQRDSRLRALHRERNRGIEASIRALYATAKGEYIFLNSADRQWPMEAMHALAEAITGGADLVIGVRRDKRAVYTPYRQVLSHAYETVVKLMGAPAGDPGSIKLGRAEALRLPVVANGVFAEGERIIRAARAGYKVVEVPVDFTARRAGKATGAKPRVAVAAAADAIRTSLSLALGWPRPKPPSCDATEHRPTANNADNPENSHGSDGRT